MITAHKYLNLDLSVINISALIIDKLKRNNLLTYNELLSMIVAVYGEKSQSVFPYALNFLFLLNKISYSLELDTFQLNETK